MSTTVRVSNETHERLLTLADTTGHRLQEVVEEAVAAYETNAFWEAFDAGYERLAADPGQWAEVQAERADEAAVLADRQSDDA